MVDLWAPRIALDSTPLRFSAKHVLIGQLFGQGKNTFPGEFRETTDVIDCSEFLLPIVDR
jgi:hypothetical protein